MSTRSHMVWPIVVILLLVGSVTTMIGVLIAASSDGGVQVVDDYYHKAANWDSIATVQRSSDALNWTVEFRLERTESGAVGVFFISDASGAGVSGLNGVVSVFRPQTSQVLGTHEMVASKEEPGTYEIEFPHSGQGLWDLEVNASRGPNRLIHRQRLDFQNLQ